MKSEFESIQIILNQFIEIEDQKIE